MDKVALLSANRAMLALLFVLAAACLEFCDAASVFDVYRAVQYDLRGIPLGSRRAGLSHHASSGLSIPGSDLTRAVVILPISKLNVTLLNEYLDSKRLLGGLLLLLPETKDEAEKHDILKKQREVEQWIVSSNIPFPVYFTYVNSKLKALLEEVTENDLAGKPATATTGGYKFVIPVPEPKKLSASTLTNLRAWLPGLKSDGDAVPTIAIVAWYDTFGAAPELSSGSDSNGSGVTTLLEVVRLFSRLYTNPKTRGRYNLLFGLTSGGPYNFDGTAKWLRSFDQRLRERIDYAICLDNLGSWPSNKLWLHVSKPPENPSIKQIHKGLSDVAAEMGFDIEVKHKKINISNSRVAWEHEQFSRQRVTAVTLSELESVPELFGNAGGISDKTANPTHVMRASKLVAESLARYIYKLEGRNVDIFADGSSLAVSQSYITGWLNMLSRTPRVAPFLSKTSPVITALQQELAEHVREVSLQHETMDSAFVFYDSTKALLNVYQVASVAFDLVLMLAVGAYLAFLFVVLIVTTKGLDDLFRRPPASRKLKSP